MNGQSLVEQAGLALSDIRVTVRDWNSACMLVKEGLGVTLIPDSALPTEQRGMRVMQLAPLFIGSLDWSVRAPAARLRLFSFSWKACQASVVGTVPASISFLKRLDTLPHAINLRIRLGTGSGDVLKHFRRTC